MRRFAHAAPADIYTLLKYFQVRGFGSTAQDPQENEFKCRDACFADPS